MCARIYADLKKKLFWTRKNDLTAELIKTDFLSHMGVNLFWLTKQNKHNRSEASVSVLGN